MSRTTNTPVDRHPSSSSSSSSDDDDGDLKLGLITSARRIRSQEFVINHDGRQSKWIGLKSIDWIDQFGNQRYWESSFRKTTDRSSTSTRPVDAVAILSLVTRPQTVPSTIIILQYRPPVDRVVVELPAGLIDPGESIEAAALRELYEETGYGRGTHGGEARIEEMSEILVNDPGMSDANMILAKVSVHFDSLDPILPEPHQEQGENIQVELIPIKDLYQTLQDYNRKPGFVVDARLMHLAFGLTIQQLV